MSSTRYKFRDAIYSDSGLYKFSLLSEFPNFKLVYDKIKKETIKIISIKYVTGIPCNEFIDGAVDRTVQTSYFEFEKKDINLIPSDWYNIVYVHQWNKNGILIKFGYQINYDAEKILYRDKLYNTVISFTYLPYEKKIEAKNHQSDISEANKF